MNKDLKIVAGFSLFSVKKAYGKLTGYAFESCTGLTSTIIPNSVTEFGIWAFSGSPGEDSIKIFRKKKKIFLATDCRLRRNPKSLNRVGMTFQQKRYVN